MTSTDVCALVSVDRDCAGDTAYNIFVDYVLLGDRSSSAHGLTSYQLKELLEDSRVWDHGRVQCSSIWSTQSKATHGRVHNSSGTVAGGCKLQFVAWLDTLLEISMQQQVDLHVNLFRV